MAKAVEFTTFIQDDPEEFYRVQIVKYFTHEDADVIKEFDLPRNTPCGFLFTINSPHKDE